MSETSDAIIPSPRLEGSSSPREVRAFNPNPKGIKAVDVELAAKFYKRGPGGLLLKSWKQRHFEYNPTNFMVDYHECDFSKIGKCVGQINLREVTELTIPLKAWSLKEESKSKYEIHIITKERTYYLATTTKEDMIKWCEGINIICNELSPDTFHPLCIVDLDQYQVPKPEKKPKLSKAKKEQTKNAVQDKLSPESAQVMLDNMKHMNKK
eukprot:TRINITY_DN7039_c0_g1_i2.p1 TRINITY_DN7039_c0_g1~~TRINITY_DN7039_c0_g1_i2.p1  ORF type:complete len:210 (-),score=55.32 TRINITY_DN7039_c0_g1_i2:213-842(-)